MNIDLVIMAGGEGRRLDPLTRIVPKPLLYMEDKTMLEHVIEFFRAQGVGKVYIITKYKSDLIKSFIQCSGLKDIEVIVEDEPLGTAGGLSLIGDRLSSLFFVSNCDVLVDVDLKAFKDNCEEDKVDMGIIAFSKAVRVPYGIFEFDDDGELSDFLEKPNIQLWANAGVYLMTHKVFEYIRPGVRMGMDELFYNMINSGSHIRVVPVDGGSFKDIGEFQYYKKVLEELC